MRLLKQAAMLAALILGFGIFGALLTVPVFAQEAVTIVEPTFTQELLTAILPALGLVITALLGWLASEFHKRTGINVEARHREALQSALMNGILFALQRSGWVPGQPTNTVLATARSYVESSVPDALKQFGIDTATDIGRATLDRLLTPKLPVPPGTVLPNGDKLVGRAP